MLSSHSSKPCLRPVSYTHLDVYKRQKITYNGAHTNLIKAVNDAIADGRTTVAEKNNVDSKFTGYKNAIADYNQRWRLPIRLSRIRLKAIRTKLWQKEKRPLRPPAMPRLQRTKLNNLYQAWEIT